MDLTIETIDWLGYVPARLQQRLIQAPCDAVVSLTGFGVSLTGLRGPCRMMASAWTAETNPTIVEEFLRALAVCHTVIPDGRHMEMQC